MSSKESKSDLSSCKGELSKTWMAFTSKSGPLFLLNQNNQCTDSLFAGPIISWACMYTIVIENIFFGILLLNINCIETSWADFSQNRNLVDPVYSL